MVHTGFPWYQSLREEATQRKVAMEAMVARIEDLERRLEETEGAVGQHHAEMRKQHGRLEELEKGKVEKDRMTRSVLDVKGTQSLPEYGGVAEQYDHWNFKVQTFMVDYFPEFRSLFNHMESTQEEVEETITRNPEAHGFNRDSFKFMDDQLYQVLAQKTMGETVATVMQLQNAGTGRGVKAWQKILWATKGRNKMRIHELSK